MPVDDRLRQPGRARRVEHPQRVVERHGLEPQRLGRTGEEVGPRQLSGAGTASGSRYGRITVRSSDGSSAPEIAR